jgi:Zn-dependent protease with chaperone function
MLKQTGCYWVGNSYGYVSEFKRRIYYTFATGVAGFWAKRKLKGKSFVDFKMAIGIIIMGFGFLFMVLLLWNLRNQVLQA